MTAATGVREAPTNVGADVGAGRRGASVEDARGGHSARYVWAVLRHAEQLTPHERITGIPFAQ